MNFYLVKSEPGTYSISDLAKDGSTIWEGVRNYAARLHLRAMKTGDRVLFYHSGDDKAVVGECKVVKTAYQDPTTSEDWSVIDLAFVSKFKKPVGLKTIKAEPRLKNIMLVRQGRLSVMPLTAQEFKIIIGLSK